MYVELDAFGDKQIRREILRWGEYAMDASPAFDSILDGWLRGAKRNFRTAGAYASGGWAELSPRTVAAKRRSKDAKTRSNAERILHATNKLRDSLTKRGAPDSIQKVRPGELRWGTKVPYAPYHQHGATDTRDTVYGKPVTPFRWTLPQRRPIELSGGPRGQRANTVKVLQLWIARGQVRRLAT